MGLNLEILSKAYHKVILKELEKLEVERKGNPPIYRVVGPGPVLIEDEIMGILKQNYSDYAGEIFNRLLESGYLLRLRDNQYRTLHVDVLVRSAELRTISWEPRYILSSLVTYDLASVPSYNDRVRINQGGITHDLYRSAERFFGNEKLARDFINILGEYVEGLDRYQVWALSEMLKSNSNVRVHVITGPTGIGKTYVFFSFILAKLMKMKAEGTESRIILVYPRKILAADQTERMLKLLKIVNEHGYKIIMALRDGDTPRSWEELQNHVIGESRRLFRGIKCPYCNSELEYTQYGVGCKGCGRKLEFLIPYREQMGETPADIIVTNKHALEVRLMDNNPQDINVEHLLKVDVIVLDEAHEYLGIQGALMRGLLKTLEELRAEYGDIKTSITYVLSSATIPSPEEFASKLTTVQHRDIRVYDFHLKTQNLIFSGERLALIAVFQMNPRFSWNTYCQLWAVLTSFIGYTREKTQSILFVNSVKELRRIKVGFEESISLGEPKDHLKDCDPAEHTFCYSHYPDSSMLGKITATLAQRRRLKELNNYIELVHSEVELEKKSDIVKRVRDGESLTLFATSSLELGVDYPNVTFILNVGYEEPRILIQRVGRGGRSPEGSLWTVLGIILLRNIPHETMFLHDPNLGDKLRVFSKPEGYLPVAVDNPAIEERYSLVKAFAKLALKGERTYASRSSIRGYEDLKRLLENILNNWGG